MKPIIIFQNVAHEGPGYLGEFLTQQSIPWQIVNTFEPETLPASIQAYSGVVLMGGPMSVNDDLPWLAPVLNLIREAVKLDTPVLGHCLGGQLMCKALGGKITQNAIKEIGWGEVQVSNNTIAKQWFGEIKTFNAFHWHGETFSLPQGATLVLSSQNCQNQAFAIGKHLAFQTHLEVTPEMVKVWCEMGQDELQTSASSVGVQQAKTMQEHLPMHCSSLSKVASQVYAQWVKGLVL
ncbi:MAG: type 1 glutamine amidotransferase [Methylophilaceae bacterium]